MPGHGFSYRKYLNGKYYNNVGCDQEQSDYCCEWDCWPRNNIQGCIFPYRSTWASCDQPSICYNVVTQVLTTSCGEGTLGFCGCSGKPCICGGGNECDDCPPLWLCHDWQCWWCTCADFPPTGSTVCVEPFPGVIRYCYPITIRTGCYVTCPSPGNCCPDFGDDPIDPIPPGATAPAGSVRSVGLPPNGPDNGLFSCPIEKALEFTLQCDIGINSSFPSSCVSEGSFEYPPGFDYYLLPDGETGLTVSTAYLCVEYGVQENDSARLQVLTGRNRYRYKGIWSAHYMRGFDGCTGPLYPSGYDDIPLLKFGLTSMGDIEKNVAVGGTFPIPDSRMDLPFFGAKTRRNPEQYFAPANAAPINCPSCPEIPPPAGFTMSCYDDRVCFNCREHDVVGPNNEGIGHYGPYPGQAPWSYGTTAGYMSFDCFNPNSSISVVHKYKAPSSSTYNIEFNIGHLDIPAVSMHSYLKGMEDWLDKFVRYKTRSFYKSHNYNCDNTWGWGYDPEDYQELTVTFGDNWWKTVDPSLTNGAGTNNVAHILDLLKNRVENIHLYVTGSSSATVPWSVNSSEYYEGCDVQPTDNQSLRIYGRTAQGKLDSAGATAFYTALFRSDGVVDDYYTTNEYENNISSTYSHKNGLSRFKLLTPNVFLWDRDAFLGASIANKWKYVYFPGSLNTLFDSGCTSTGLISDGGDPPNITGSVKKIIKVDETGHRSAFGPGIPNTCRAVKWQACNRTLEDMDSSAVVRITPLRCNGAPTDADPSDPPGEDEFCLWCSGELGTSNPPGPGYTVPCLSWNETPLASYSKIYQDKSCGSVSGLIDGQGCTYMPEVSLIAAGLYHSALITEENKILHCWGSNTSGQSNVPQKIQYYEFDDVSCGAEHTVALTSNRRSIYCWGNNSFGQCGGNPATANASTSIKRTANPDCNVVGYGDEIRIATSVCDVDFPPPDEEIIKVVAGSYYTLALLGDGTLTGWGDNRYGQLNIPNKKFSGVNAFGNTVVAVEQGGNTAVAWGANSSNQLLSYPLGVSGFPSIDSIDLLAAGGDTAENGHVLVSDGNTVLAFGLNNFDQANPPAILERYGNTIEYLSAGKHHSAALTKSAIADSSIPYCWGRNLESQCDIPTALNMTLDTNINGRIKMIVCGGYHTLALTDIIPGNTASGIVIGWGDNTYGQASTPSCTIPLLPS